MIDSLAYRADGPEGAPAVILGPSIGTTHDLWQPQLEALARTYRVIRYDLPGHTPEAAIPPSPFSIDDLADGVLTLADSLGVESFAIGGVSLGGAIAATTAVRAPDRVAKLVLCCTSARFGDPGQWHERAALVRGRGMDAVIDTAIGRWFTDAYAAGRPEPVRRVVEMLEGVEAEGYARCCEALAGYDLRDRLAGITASTLVIAGADDPSTPPSHGRVFIDGITGTKRLAVIPDAAHLANVQRPEPVTAEILAHLS